MIRAHRPAPARRALRGLAAALAVGGAGVAGGPGAIEAPPAAVRAQAVGALQPATPVLVATLHTPLVAWSAPPGAAVEARLERGGRTVATTRGRAGRDGSVELTLEAPSRGEAAVRPQDLLVLSADGGAEARAIVPDLVASPDPPAGRILGRARQAAAVTVTVAGDPGPPHRLVPGPDGRFEADLGAGALAPGDRGWVERADGGHRFRAEWAVLDAAAEVGTPWVSGEATPGGRIALQRVPPGAGEPSLATVAGDGTRAGGARFDIGVREAIRPGTTIRVTETLPLVPARSWQLVVPALDVALDPAGSRAHGTAPDGTAVDVVLQGPDGERATRRATAGPDGRYEAVFAGTAIGPGWRAAATVPGADGLGTRARASIAQVRATLHDAVVSGVAAPRGQAVVTLRRPGEPPRGPWRAEVAPDGAFAVELADAPGGVVQSIDLLPGDSLFVDLAGGDPLVVEVPALTAVADGAADVVAGTAPPGARLRVTAAVPGTAARTATAGADGRWQVSWAGEADLATGDAGEVAATLGGGHLAILRWAVVGVVVDVGTGALEGNAPGGRAVAVSLAAADGSPLGTASAAADRLDPLGRWRAEVRDALGQVVPLREGDRLALDVGDERIALVVPPLEGVVHVADDLVGGRTRPGARVAVSVARPEGEGGEPAVARVTAEASGGYAAAFGAGSAAPWDIRYNDRVRLEVEDGAHRFARAVDAPGLVVDVGNGIVRGSLEPGLRAVAALERGGARIASAPVAAGPDATFRVALRGPGESPPAEGDVVVVTADGARAARELRLVVASHALALEASAGRASGRTVAGGRVRLATHHAFGAAPDGGPHDLTAGPDGAWSWSDAAPLAPGTRVGARAVLPSGHILERADTVPILSVQLGSDRVCGRGAPLAPVALRARGGALSGGGRADEEGGFAVRLAAGDGSPAILAPTDRVEAEVGAARLAAEPRGFHVALGEGGRGIQGVAEGTDRVDLLHPVGAVDCRGSAAAPFPAARDAFAPFADGRFRFIQRELATWLPEGVELAWVDRADGQRRFWRSSPLHVLLHIRTDRVDGTVAPGAELRVAVRGPGGTERGAARAIGRPDGRFEARLAGPAGEPIALVAGDVVVIEPVEPPGAPLALDVLRLDLDFAPGTAIVGEAPARHPVDVRLHLTDGRVVDLALAADETGGWSVGADAIPPRSGWSLADIAGVRAMLPLAGGHAVVVAAGRGAGPPDAGRVLFIPAGERP